MHLSIECILAIALVMYYFAWWLALLSTISANQKLVIVTCTHRAFPATPMEGYVYLLNVVGTSD